MPERPSLDTTACRAIMKLREHSRNCHCVEARRRLIATERWLMWMVLREEAKAETADAD